MGMNLQSCCHKCRVKQFHYRGKENDTLLPFYQRHYDCMRENPRNIETLEDQIQEADWMCGRDGYPDEDAKDFALCGLRIKAIEGFPDNVVAVSQQGQPPQIFKTADPSAPA